MKCEESSSRDFSPVKKSRFRHDAVGSDRANARQEAS